MDTITITGTIVNYIYESPDSMYKVCKLVTSDDDIITIVGSFPHLDEGLAYDFIGTMKTNPKYGDQFSVESYQKSKSFTRDGVIEYLSSEKFYGIGPKVASAIVDKLGLDCIDKIVDDPTVLDGISGLTKPKKEVIINQLKDNYANEQVFIRLYGFGLSSKMIGKLYDRYGLKAANMIEENPYRLINEVDGFGFKKSDNLALSLGFKKNDPRRIEAALVYTLSYVCYQQGYTFLTRDQLINSAKKLIDDSAFIDDVLYDDSLSKLVDEKVLIAEEDRYFERSLYYDELKSAEKLLKISQTKIKLPSKDKVNKSLEYIENLNSFSYTPLQKEAIANAILNKLSIITGGPGTGKSTILKGILSVYAHLIDSAVSDDIMSYKVLMVAPTGRAAKRMTEATGFKASTIHKALGYNFEGNFTYDESNLMSYSLLIVDEASMVDITLFKSLIVALSNNIQIILVGDSNQLPSVGPGNVLADLIQSSIFKTTKLTQIMRQAHDSDIIRLSSMVLSEHISYDIFSRKKEVYYYDYEAKNAINGIFRILDNYLANGGDLQNGIQILAPMYAGPCGIDAINTAIQERYNKNEKSIVRDNQFFKKDDKVLQLKNDSELDIMNGDIGKILDIVKTDENEYLLINFDDRIVKYDVKNLDDLKLAYCISIHKSQGSEFDNVIMPILPSYQIMLKKKIVYTGITRAKKKIIILGKLDSLEKSLHSYDYNRQTALLNRIENNKIETVERIVDPTIPFDTFGEYDMEGITPYSFM